MKVKKGDTVLVIAGKDKGARGKVIQAYPDLGRVFDRRIAGDVGSLRTSVSNRADFLDMFRAWARASVQGLDTLKGRPPSR